MLLLDNCCGPAVEGRWGDEAILELYAAKLVLDANVQLETLARREDPGLGPRELPELRVVPPL